MIKLGLVLTALILIASSSTHAEEEFSSEFTWGLRISSWYMYLSILSEYQDGGNMNFVFSPLSIHQLLGVLYYGAAGETERQLIEKALQLEKMDKGDVLLQFELMKTYFFGGRSGVTYPTKLANKAYISENYKIKKDYTNVVQGLFAFDTESFNLQTHSARKIASNINKWVSQETLGKITDLVDKSYVTPYTAMILVNALYFKAKWINEFSPTEDTIDWMKDDGSIEYIPGIETKDTFYYYDDASESGMIYVAVPFDTDKIAAYFVLAIPKRRYPGALKGFGEGVMPDMLVNIMPKLKLYNEFSKDTNKWIKSNEFDVLRIPEYTIKSKFDLKKMMASMGADQMFKQNADFSKIAGRPGDIYISEFQHSAVVEVSRTGVEAAAATVAVVGTRSLASGRVFVGNQPFFYGIYQDDFFIFMGNCYKPKTN